jgi:hypothetical protein
MKPTEASPYRLAYKWLTWFILLAFGYYWIITTGLMIFGNGVSSAIPNQTFVYRTFARQNWRMFAFAKVYNRQMLFITRDIANPSQTDTTDLVQYLLAEKRAYAPFNNKQDAVEKILYLIMNDLEVRVHNYEKKIKDTLPGKTAALYKQLAIEAVKADTAHQLEINNIRSYGHAALQQMKRSAAGKEYQLIIKHIYIPPSKPALPVVPGGNEEILFISNYKPL